MDVRNSNYYNYPLAFSASTPDLILFASDKSWFIDDEIGSFHLKTVDEKIGFRGGLPRTRVNVLLL